VSDFSASLILLSESSYVCCCQWFSHK